MSAPITALSRLPLATLANRTLLTDLALIAAIWCLGSIIVNPVGEFPLNDDWSYSRAVRALIETGDYRPLGWAVMSLFTHVLWGALFSMPAGFSFTALRISTLVAGLLGLFGVYVLMRDSRQPRWLALLVTLIVAFYPAYFVLSHTFMTDIPFTAAAVWSAVFMARGLRRDSNVQLLVGTLLAAAAMLSRQVGLAIPLAFAAVLLIRPHLNRRKVMQAVVPLIVCVSALLVYNNWLEATERAPIQYTELSNTPLKHSDSLLRIAYTLSFFGFYTPVYLGLFLLPLFLCAPRRLLWSDTVKTEWRSYRTFAIGLASLGLSVMAAAAVFLAVYRYRMLLPMGDRGNMLGQFGLGPFSLRDSIILRLDHHLAAVPTIFWIVVTTLGVIGGVLLILRLSVSGARLASRLLHRQDVTDDEAISMFLVVCAFVYLLPFLSYGFYDRYLMLVLPFLAASLATLSGNGPEWRWQRHRASVAALVMLSAWGSISIAGTRDYLTWNRVRWQALNELTQKQGIPATEIDGGFEFNGLHFYDPNYKSDPAKSSWWVQHDTYQIGFGAVPGYTVVKEHAYQHWFPPHVQKIVIMQRAEHDPAADTTQ